MPYAYGADISHTWNADHIELLLTFHHPMAQDLTPDAGLWELLCDTVATDIVSQAWLDAHTLKLVSDTLATEPTSVTIAYNGPSRNLTTTWGKQWEPWGDLPSNTIQTFTDRGNPANPDWTQLTITQDAAYHDLDLSGIVPIGTKAVLLTVGILSTSANRLLRFRKKGNSNNINITETRTQVANQAIYALVVVGVDENRLIEYYASNAAFTGINVTVSGWWK
jgi:hypothetical protein